MRITFISFLMLLISGLAMHSLTFAKLILKNFSKLIRSFREKYERTEKEEKKKSEHLIMYDKILSIFSNRSIL